MSEAINQFCRQSDQHLRFCNIMRYVHHRKKLAVTLTQRLQTKSLSARKGGCVIGKNL